jgi:trk system potassium uptake protein TrkA
VFVLIVGGGKVGTYLARALLAQKHEVVVVEKEARKAQYMSNILDVDVAVVGDGCDPLVLQQAGISRADVVVADTGDDEDNLVVCLIAKKQSKARCIARVNNPKNKPIFESIDRERPITLVSSTEIILDLINEYVNAHDYSIVTKLRDGDLELVKLAVGADSPANGKRIADIGLPRGSIVVAVDRQGHDLLIPSGDTALRGGDEVVVMCKRDGRADVRRAIAGAKIPA